MNNIIKLPPNPLAMRRRAGDPDAIMNMVMADPSLTARREARRAAYWEEQTRRQEEADRKYQEAKELSRWGEIMTLIGFGALTLAAILCALI